MTDEGGSMIPIEDEKWYDIYEYGAKTHVPPGHRIEYARDEGAIVVRIVGPNAYVWGKSDAGKEALDEAIDFALDWFSKVGGEL